MPPVSMNGDQKGGLHSQTYYSAELKAKKKKKKKKLCVYSMSSIIEI